MWGYILLGITAAVIGVVVRRAWHVLGEFEKIGRRNRAK